MPTSSNTNFKNVVSRLIVKLLRLKDYSDPFLGLLILPDGGCDVSVLVLPGVIVYEYY